METGIGFSEVILICVLILIFFGSKELPKFMREAGKLTAGIRRYKNKIEQEINVLSSEDTASTQVSEPYKSISLQKDELRKKYIALRKSLDPTVREEKSSIIYENLKENAIFRNASSVMIYLSIGSEVDTRKAVKNMLEEGRRVFVPYCLPDNVEMRIAEIKDMDKDLVQGRFNILEPVAELRGGSFKSDVRLVVCPGLAFDKFGLRLGRGKAYYDSFLKEMKGKVPIVGIAFDCQISEDSLPFEYHDIMMDQVFAESGPLFSEPSASKPVARLTSGQSPAG